MAYGMNSPALFAWVTDLSDDNNRGRAFGSLYIALELGIGLGAIISGFTYANNPENFLLAFGTAAWLALLASTYLIFTNPKK
jgi:predicted MFS family arabinose efflux permease